MLLEEIIIKYILTSNFKVFLKKGERFELFELFIANDIQCKRENRNLRNQIFA